MKIEVEVTPSAPRPQTIEVEVTRCVQPDRTIEVEVTSASNELIQIPLEVA